MAKLFAEIDSDKHGRKASKGGDTFLLIDIYRGNTKVGRVGVYEVVDVNKGTYGGLQFTPVNAYRIAWQPVTGKQVMLEDTEQYAGYCPCTGDESMQETRNCKHCGLPCITLKANSTAQGNCGICGTPRILQFEGSAWCPKCKLF